ncbi:Thioesterase/thiol ester dehydrase-isomerase [Saitoella complicata NRRL Y-17804]|uniref:Thioesterase/thiol ester dehydrase-isomerase n=1 Tax=Saitoella complicata (strain BCRC 22490 / CBS 7301 / JCM 7358 / NBRC 10748 / NRRL Y-17804) TaxID=698492 RepID=UPI0008672D7E|nr:Thioesterase/thiol ester dehydrase-isomerase [Saitoella complicata NRRL Y-17804]ODQ54666.1 Thioesterase/thiol ester dehydrase-isomerase [Saitoella complicata NRRL Y-17804]
MAPTTIPPSARLKSNYKYFLTHNVRWSDVDRYAHVNNSIYHHYFDTIANEYLVNHCNMNPEQSDLVGLMIASTVRFFSPITFPGSLTLGLTVSHIGATSVEYQIAVWQDSPAPSEEDKAHGREEGKEGLACAVCFATHVFVRRVGHVKVKGMEEGVRRGLERILVESGGGEGKGKL